MTTMTMAATMKAVRIHAFGGPEVLQYEDAPRPEPAPNQLLVRIHAAGVNPVDWKIRQGLLGDQTLPQIMGSDLSGVVEAVGPEVSEFHIGEPVFGIVAEDSGSYADYATATSTRVAHRPEALDDIHAAAIPVAGLTAWQALFDTADLKPKQRILIHAAAGGVGSFAVQFAHWKGAYVIGTASGENFAYLHELGADEVIDYHTTRFEEVLRDVDVVLDTLGGETQERSWRVLRPGGVLVSLIQPPKVKTDPRGMRGVFLSSKPRGDQLAKIAELVINGQVRVNVEKTFPLSEARQAQELSQKGHLRGKIVLVMDEHN